MKFPAYRFACLCVCAVLGMAQGDSLAEAVVALQAGNAARAESILQEELRAHPANGEALALLGVALDQQKKFAEADDVYCKAVAIDPKSPSLRNNYGNHLLLGGNFKQAEEQFRRVVALAPANVNARMQLTRLVLREKSPAKALTYLDGLPATAHDRPDALLLRMQAEYQLGKKTEAEAIRKRLSAEAEHDAQATVALGSALFAAQQYDQAEQVFARAMTLAPSSFDAVYYRGLAAARAGRHTEAREFLEQALRQQPANIDAMYDLAVVNAKLGNRETAIQLLGQASRAAPNRADLLQLMARLTAQLGYFADSVAAWDKYLKVTPGDASARRERAFVQTAIAEQSAAGIAALTAYVREHPADPIGHYELGTAECATDTELALREFDRAIALNPELTPARFARGLLYQRQGKTDQALADFAWAAKRLPGDAIVLDRLGDAQLELNQVAAAVATLRSAAQLAPGNVTVLNHLGRALQKDGKSGEARVVFARLRELGPTKPEPPHPAGLLDFLSLSPEEQLLRYRTGVERTVQKNPDNLQAELQYMRLLLDDGKTATALSVARKIASLKPAPALAREAEQALVAAEQYDAAKQFRADVAESRIQ
ncbi:MAG TPA: tetratricopeptide repeat protein [Bryobacteraceae bacterium]